MFTNPIKHTRLTSLEEVMSFSYNTGRRATPLTKCQNNGQIAFSDAWGCVFVTPYREEIHGILEESGYKDETFFVPFSNGEERPEAYHWLTKIAEEECWAYTHEQAFELACQKGIQPVKITGKCQIKQIPYDDRDTQTRYAALAGQFLLGESQKNIATYIVVDEKTLVICDEYGRSFLIKAKTVVNDLVNALISAGYTRTRHPNWYVKHYEHEPTEE